MKMPHVLILATLTIGLLGCGPLPSSLAPEEVAEPAKPAAGDTAQLPGVRPELRPAVEQEEEPEEPLFICLGDAVVEDAEDLELLADCERITGDLILDTPDVAHLDPLAHLREVGGDLFISNAGSLVDLEGLAALERVGGSFTLSYNWALEGLSLPQLSEVGASFILEQQHALAYLELPGLKAVHGDVFIDPNWNHGLESIDLSSLEEVDGDFTLQGAYMLADLDVSNLEEVEGVLTLNWGYAPEAVVSLGALTDTGGLVLYGATVTELHAPQLEVVWGDFDLATPAVERLEFPALEMIVGRFTHGGAALELLDMPELVEVRGDVLFSSSGIQSLSGLSQLEEISGTLQLRHMDLLLDTGGLSSLREVEALVVENNALLAEVRLGALRSVEGDISVTLNDALTSLRLPNVEEIEGAVLVEDNLVLGICGLSDFMGDLNQAEVEGTLAISPGDEAEQVCP